MGLANRVVGRGEAARRRSRWRREIARFPQSCLRADRLSALRQWDLPEEEAIANEMRGGLEVIASGETLSGATRFASGAAATARLGEVTRAIEIVRRSPRSRGRRWMRGYTPAIITYLISTYSSMP